MSSVKKKSHSYDEDDRKRRKAKKSSRRHSEECSEDSESDDARPGRSSGHKSKKHKEKRDSSRSSERKEAKKSKKDKKHSKKRRSSRSSSSSSSSSEEESVELLKRLHSKQERLTEVLRREKELIKATETSEEKRIRRLLKKEAKERRRKERMGWDKDYLHYTNTDNPFGDANLLCTFVWSKKLAKDGLDGVSREELERINRMKQEENKAELEKVKKRRQEREKERQEREEAMMRSQREKEAEQFEAWAQQEDQFHLEQARLRSTIRIADGRAKPIDLLAKYINSSEEVDAVEMHEPYTYLTGLTIKDLEDLVEDIQVYMKLEKGKNLDYWNDITVIVEDELYKLRKMEKKSEYEAAVGRREGIHESVAEEVASVFRGKTAGQLSAMQKSIEKKISDKTEGLDIGYWESLLSQLKAHMARARLRDKHQENLRRKLELLKAEQLKTEVKEEHLLTAPTSPSVKSEPRSIRSGCEGPGVSHDRGGSGTEDDNEEEEVDGDDDIGDEEGEQLVREGLDEYEAGGYSPVYLEPDSLEPATLVIPEEEDMRRLDYARLRLAGLDTLSQSTEEKAMEREARKGMTGDEALFSVEATLDSQLYLWSDKYRPRKPRYFNRVHTGFEWNKYNQTHYDMDNPPPKIVQGYKFNIFYPDLIDKTTTPEYYLTSCPDNPDFAVLRFHAGPPYEDIAFKIVNREWEYSYKRGFRCQFHNNIFQLWFHFKRYRYRR